MNKWGIGLTVLALLLGVLALYLGVEVYDARSRRLAELGEFRDQVDKLEADLLTEELAVQAKKSQVINAQQTWGRVFNGVGNTAVTNEQTGLIELGLGTQSGLAAAEVATGRPLPAVHVYALEPQNPQASRYLGEFKLNGATNTFSTAQLRRQPIPGETEDWVAPAYRVRTKAPNAYGTLLGELSTEYQIARQALVAEQSALAEIERQAALVQRQIDARIAEINGNPDRADAPAVIRDGLVATIAQTERRREQAAAETASLRQTYYDQFVEFERILAAIQRLAKRLPGAGSGSSVDLSAGPSRVN